MAGQFERMQDPYKAKEVPMDTTEKAAKAPAGLPNNSFLSYHDVHLCFNGASLIERNLSVYVATVDPSGDGHVAYVVMTPEMARQFGLDLIAEAAKAEALTSAARVAVEASKDR